MRTSRVYVANDDRNRCVRNCPINTNVWMCAQTRSADTTRRSCLRKSRVWRTGRGNGFRPDREEPRVLGRIQLAKHNRRPVGELWRTCSECVIRNTHRWRAGRWSHRGPSARFRLRFVKTGNFSNYAYVHARPYGSDYGADIIAGADGAKSDWSLLARNIPR